MSSINRASCYICKCVFQSSIKYDINETLSSSTFTPLSQLIESTLKTKLFLDDQTAVICADCLGILNELDSHQSRANEIKEAIEKHLEGTAILKTLNVYTQTDQVPAQLETTELEYSYVVAEEEMHLCKRCGIALKSSDELKEHLKTHVIAMYECGECKQTFLSKNGYVVHLRKKHGVKNDEDEDSAKRAKNSGENNVKAFVCEKCGQTYKNKNALDIHVGMHNGVFPFTCEYCNKSFTQKAALQRHIPIHTGTVNLTFHKNYIHTNDILF